MGYPISNKMFLPFYQSLFRSDYTIRQKTKKFKKVVDVYFVIELDNAASDSSNTAFILAIFCLISSRVAFESI